MRLQATFGIVAMVVGLAFREVLFVVLGMLIYVGANSEV